MRISGFFLFVKEEKVYNTHMYEDLAVRIRAFNHEHQTGGYKCSDDYYYLFLKFEEMFKEELKEV